MSKRWPLLASWLAASCFQQLAFAAEAEDDGFLPALRTGLAFALSAMEFNRSMLSGLGSFFVNPLTLNDAVEMITKAVELRPQHVDAVALLGALVGVFGKDARTAMKHFTRVLEFEPCHYQTHLGLGLLWFNLEHLKAAVSCHPGRAEGWLAFGTANAADPAQAKVALLQAIRLRPRSRRVVGLAGTSLRRLGAEESANEIFADATARGLWHHELQRPRAIFWPGLRSSKPSPMPGKEIEERWPLYRQAREAAEKAIKAFSLAGEFQKARDMQPPQEGSATSLSYWVQQCDDESDKECRFHFDMIDLPSRARGRWAEYTIWDPRRHDAAGCSSGMFPGACELLHALVLAGFPVSRVGVTEVHPPRTLIPRHHSPQQGRLRLTCPLLVPSGSVSRLAFGRTAELLYSSKDVGECWWIDESFEHELEYEGDQPRATLVIDAPHPALVIPEQADAPPLWPQLGAPDIDSPWSYLWTAFAEMAPTFGMSIAEALAGWSNVTSLAEV
eukprot:TRINITY_DN113200_c0_g1_i2.p1 TRINITY_DN113200_c0_g1~~TRINITY_DN113200_c0_g1_i2.p1  ORF type:complete len:502 (+),score=93.26 TRINITY_DN113200_c0_g1_i2:67-1572(+)